MSDSPFDPAQAIKLVAADLPSLQKDDVYRLLNAYPSHQLALANWVVAGRLNLLAEVQKCLDALGVIYNLFDQLGIRYDFGNKK